MLVCGAGAGTATAGNSSDPTATATADSPDPTTYTARVSYTSFGTGNGDGSQPVKSSDTAFVPPVCWYTAMTPEQMKAEILRRYSDAGQKNAGTVYNFYNDQNNQMDRDHYHQGQDGSWWVLTYDEQRLAAGDYSCPYDQGYFWRKPGDPPEGRITAEMLADAAYGQLMLPTKGVTLSPVPDNQKVNLPTYVRYKQAGTQVSVTAQLTEPGGQTLAATVVAQPYSLRVDAGTPYANPSTCDYTLRDGSLDSAGASCNITYRKASAGTYPMTADMTWRVWWTPTATAQRDGTRMADGLSEFPQAVTVQEIQTVNR
jgi:hypothetical protein